MIDIKILFLFVPLFLIGVLIKKNVEISSRLRVNSFSTSFVFLCILLYVPSLIAGSLSFYNAETVYTLSIVTSLLFVIVGRKYFKIIPTIEKDTFEIKINKNSAIVGSTGLLLMAPVFILFYDFPYETINKNIWLPWDSVSYHLPALVEYFQAESFWSQEGPYQSYSFAYEILVNFGVILFPSHVGFVIGNILSVLFFCAALYHLIEIIASRTRIVKSIHPIAMFTFNLGLWCLVFKNKLVSIGKNDIFQTACILISLTFLFELFLTPAKETHRKKYLLIFAACAAGLGLATKPTALAYVPFFIVMVGLCYWNPATKLVSNLKSKSVLLPAGVFITVLYLLGGFFLTRNLLIYGTINPMPSAWDLTLIANITNSALYELKLGGLVFLCGVISILFWIIPYLVAETKKAKQLIFFMALFHICAMCTFTITPHAIFHHTTEWTAWKLRLGLPLFTCMTIASSLALFCLVERGSFPKAISSILLLSVPCFGFTWLTFRANYVHLPGLPHYERIKNFPATDAYKWVQKQDHPLRIYSAGLRPYGMSGKRWQNELFYDLHSTGLVPLEKGKSRIISILYNFKPDLIAISIDPHPYSGNRMPDVVDWMKNLPNCFVLEYSDDAVQIFRVEKGALHILDPKGTESKAKFKKMRG